MDDIAINQPIGNVFNRNQRGQYGQGRGCHAHVSLSKPVQQSRHKLRFHDGRTPIG